MNWSGMWIVNNEVNDLLTVLFPSAAGSVPFLITDQVVLQFVLLCTILQEGFVFSSVLKTLSTGGGVAGLYPMIQCIPLLPTASEGWGKVMLSHVSVCLSTAPPGQATQRAVCLLRSRRRTFLLPSESEGSGFVRGYPWSCT